MSQTSDKTPRSEEELFGACLDGELTAEEQKDFDDRLGSDVEFSERFSRHRSTVDLLRSMGPIPAPEDMVAHFERRLARRVQLRLDTTPHVRFPLEFLSAVLVLVGVLYSYFVLVPVPPSQILEVQSEASLRIDLPNPVEESLLLGLGLQSGGRSPSYRLYETTATQEEIQRLVEQLSPFHPEVSRIPTGSSVRVWVTVPLEAGSKPPDSIQETPSSNPTP